MDDAMPGPQRMRYSFESRCRAVAAMVAGLSPGVAAQAVGREPRDGLSLVAALWDRGLGGAAGAPVHAQAPAPTPRRGRRG